jgi:VWFA-related protein
MSFQYPSLIDCQRDESALKRVFLLLLLVAVAAWGQEPETTIRSNTRLVEVDVVVRAKGKPVEDLKAEDFTVLDQGKSQRVASFAVRRNDAQPMVRALPDGEISNRLNRLGEEPANATVILFDTLNSDPEDLAETRRQLLIYLGRANPRDRLALYSLNKTLKVVQDFTDDPERLRQMVTRW